jgi:outer membrane protein OmpA-like peptidoglycan-associated protein
VPVEVPVPIRAQVSVPVQGNSDPETASSLVSKTPDPGDSPAAGPAEQDLSVTAQSTETKPSGEPEDGVDPAVEPPASLPESPTPVEAVEAPSPAMDADEAVVADVALPAEAEAKAEDGDGDESESISELERQLRVLPVEIETLSGGHYKLDLGESVQFSGGDTTLSAGARTILADLAEILRDSDTAMVRVIGHTDTSGPEWVNDTLSAQRAASVARFLALRGVPGDRLSSEGRGMRELKIDVEQEQRLGPGINRRIEIEVRTSEASPD